MLYRGIGGPVDFDSALSHWATAASLGKANAARHLGLALLRSENHSQSCVDGKSGLDWLLLAARHGDADAMLLISKWPAAVSCLPNASIRRFWRDRAALNGHPEAQLLIGEELMTSFVALASSPSAAGSTESLNIWRAASVWLHRAAAYGNVDAMLRLAFATCHPGAPPNEASAAKSWSWLQRALSVGIPTYAIESTRFCLQTHYNQGLAVPCSLAAPVAFPKSLPETLCLSIEDTTGFKSRSCEVLTNPEVDITVDDAERLPVLKVWSAAGGTFGRMQYSSGFDDLSTEVCRAVVS